MASIVAVAGLVAALGAAVLSRAHPPSTVSAPQGRLQDTSSPCVRPDRQVVPTHHMLVLGASYTAAVGATDPRHGYAWQVASGLGETPRVYGFPGAGFLDQRAAHRASLLQHLRHVPAGPRPDLVLIQGGRNDRGAPGPETSAAEETICLAHQRFAAARIVLLGPIPASFPVRPDIVQTDADLRSACRDEHVAYLDPLEEHWLTPALARRFAGPVRDHPNDAGYRYLAERVTADLRELLRSGADRPA